MSFQALRWGFDPAREVGGNPRHVLLELCDHANNHNEAWPTVERLVQRTGLSHSSVERALTSLEGRLVASIGWRQGARLRRLLIAPDDHVAAARARLDAGARVPSEFPLSSLTERDEPGTLNQHPLSPSRSTRTPEPLSQHQDVDGGGENEEVRSWR